MHVHRGGGLLAGPSANGSTRVEQGVLAKCTNEPPAIGRVSEVSPAGLYRGKPDSLKEVLRFRLPTRRTLSLPQELGEHADGSLLTAFIKLSVSLGRVAQAQGSVAHRQNYSHSMVPGGLEVMS
jgi:hypothetical protein